MLSSVNSLTAFPIWLEVGGNGAARLIEAPARDFDIQMFQGDPTRAQAILGWRARTPLAIGLAQLAAAFRGVPASS